MSHDSVTFLTVVVATMNSTSAIDRAKSPHLCTMRKISKPRLKQYLEVLFM